MEEGGWGGKDGKARNGGRRSTGVPVPVPQQTAVGHTLKLRVCSFTSGGREEQELKAAPAAANKQRLIFHQRSTFRNFDVQQLR